MNRSIILTGTIITVCVIAILLIKYMGPGTPAALNAAESIESKSNPNGHSISNTSKKVAAEKPASSPANPHDEAGFDFTPYVSDEMANEIRPYTSRSMNGLEVKIDKNGHEYVDLKKRWSHATISVVDKHGVKHTGEWAPQK